MVIDFTRVILSIKIPSTKTVAATLDKYAVIAAFKADGGQLPPERDLSDLI